MEITHEIELVGGYKENRRVVFGKRITAKDLMRIDVDPQSQQPTQYQDLIIAEAITELGTLPTPVPLQALLDLDSIDREDLAAGYEEFQAKSMGDRKADMTETGATLLFGFRISELEYPIVEFGKRLTGRDEVEADRRGLKPGVARMLFLVGRQITKVKTADGASEIEGPIELAQMETLDGADVQILRSAAELWRQSFRRGGGRVRGDSAVGADSQ